MVAVSGESTATRRRTGTLSTTPLGEIRYDYQRQIYEHVTAGAFAVRRLDDAPAMIDRAIATGDRPAEARLPRD